MTDDEKASLRQYAEHLSGHDSAEVRASGAIAGALLAVVDAIEAQTLAISQLLPMTDAEGTPIIRTWPFEPGDDAL